MVLIWSSHIVGDVKKDPPLTRELKVEYYLAWRWLREGEESVPVRADTKTEKQENKKHSVSFYCSWSKEGDINWPQRTCSCDPYIPLNLLLHHSSTPYMTSTKAFFHFLEWTLSSLTACCSRCLECSFPLCLRCPLNFFFFLNF